MIASIIIQKDRIAVLMDEKQIIIRGDCIAIRNYDNDRVELAVYIADTCIGSCDIDGINSIWINDNTVKIKELFGSFCNSAFIQVIQ